MQNNARGESRDKGRLDLNGREWSTTPTYRVVIFFLTLMMKARKVSEPSSCNFNAPNLMDR